MRIFTPSANTYQAISQLLLQGEVVAIPTETVYGLAANALNPEAVKKIYEIKGRPAHNPLIIHVPSAQAASNYVELNAAAKRLMDAFWPGPLTLVLPKKPCIPDIVTANLPTVGIRCPRHPAMLGVLEAVDLPLAAPSANPSNYISPTRIEHITNHLEGRLKYALDGGACEEGLESTIVDLSTPNNPKLLRPGPISKGEIEKVLGCQMPRPTNTAPANPEQEQQQIVTSPGQLKVHYSPHTPLTLLSSGNRELTRIPIHQKMARVRFWKRFQQVPELLSNTQTFYLSETLDHKEAESRLYTLLQELDQAGFDHIIVDPVPSGEKWTAIHDRLTRAASR